MDKSQYHPPVTEHSAEIYNQVEKSATNNPEQLRAPFQFVKNIETLVDSFRDTAEEIERTHGREITFKLLPISFVRPARKREDIRRELVDAERVIGGQLFAEKNKYYFWYGEKGDSAIRTKDVADWYIEEINPGQPGSSITHIETHPQYIKKFNHYGQRVPVTLSDLEIFIPAVYYYIHAIMDVYPFEKDRADVILDGLELPEDVSVLLPPEYRNTSKTNYDLAA